MKPCNLLVEVESQAGGSLHLADQERHHRLRHQVEAGGACRFLGTSLRQLNPWFVWLEAPIPFSLKWIENQLDFDTFEWLVSQHPQKTLLPGLTEKLPCKKNKGGRKNRYFLLLSPQPTQFDPSSQEAAGKESCLGAKRRAEAETKAGKWAWAQLRFMMRC